MQIIPPWQVLVVQAGGFSLVVLVFAKYLFKPIMAILEARRAEIGNQYESAEEQLKSADELKSDYEKRLAGIEEEMRAKITEAIKDGQAMREEIISDSRTQADRILTKAQEEIVREKEIAFAELKGRVADLTIGATTKLIDENLDDKKHRDLIGKFIEDLEGAQK